MSSSRSPDTPPAPLSQAESAQWFFENAHDLFAVVAEGRFATVNPAWTRLTGWTAAELIGQSPLKFVDPADHQELLESGKVIQGMGGAVMRVRMICKDDRRIWLEAHARLGPAGEIVGTLRDVSAEVARKAEQAVSRRTREMLASAAGVGVWSFDPIAQRVEWSSDILSLTGLRPEEVSTPDAFYARLDEPERSRVRSTFLRAVRTGQGGTIEHHMRGATGQKFAFRATFQTEPRPGGVFALRGISQNITDVARDRDLARWGEEKARKLVEGAPFAVALYDRELRLTVVSPRFLDIFQATEAEVIGKSLHDLTYGSRKRFVAAVERALTGQTVVRREDSLTDGHGREHRLRWEARPWRDATGAIAGVITYMDDVTALTEARREARANARRLKTALGAAQAGVYEIDHAEKTFWGSPEFHRILGQRITFDDVRQAIWPMIRSEDVAAVYAAGAVGRWGERAFDARVVRPNGEERWIRLFHEIRRDASGRVRKAYGLVLDIDEQKRAELALVEAERAAQAANEAKAQFLANMSHEIRTPMNGVLGVIHLLKRQGLSAEADHLLGEALACGRMLSTLLDDIIDFSRIEAGRLDVAPEPIDPADLVHSVARLLRAQAEHKGLALVVDAPDQGVVLADPTRLRQALFNLVGNAVKFTLSGSVSLRLRRAEGDKLVFEVSDTGVGIPREAQQRLFQRFQQADASTTRRFGGSGLGLAITRRLAQMMGGEVEFSSIEGEGSTFSLSISAPPVQTAPRDESAGDKMLEGLKVLVVEDNPTNRMVARRILEMLGADVETAEDGLSGVEAAERGFDLILMDVQMPGVDGLEAARRIRALPGPVGATPIVALTANVLAHQRATYMAAGMNGVAAKPISPTALLAEIVRVAEVTSAAETAAA
ncbi:hybrid sensor histidine kinase/response regulator [Caulobacter flavus]|uniref:histidine kinase n=1 Tax=Caulobacter flavus TaxID=1679497 RepID=A0A2N5D681_9CAUL|nr:PAS domain S-box protein [Caulobacter flavus]AYV45890.1 hybrid sensor histidine kinase/response regulator [Caulobacter flavus]PLR21568.1 hybrid sensor histidine kinase/response regulator [Caulobacter flavus]